MILKKATNHYSFLYSQGDFLNISSLHPLEKLLNVNYTETKQGLWFLCLQHKDCGKCVFTSQECFLVWTL